MDIKPSDHKKPTTLFRLESKIDIQSAEFKLNKAQFLRILEEYRTILKQVRHGAPPKAIERHKQRGKLLARERIDLLIDPNTPFLELSPLAAYGEYDNQFPSAGIITGIGVIEGREALIIANDATIKGGIDAVGNSENFWTGKDQGMGRSLFAINNTDETANAYLTESGFISKRTFLNNFNNPDGTYSRRVLYGWGNPDEISNGMLSRVENYLMYGESIDFDVSRFVGHSYLSTNGMILPGANMSVSFDNQIIYSLTSDYQFISNTITIPANVKTVTISLSNFSTQNSITVFPFHNIITGYLKAYKILP